MEILQASFERNGEYKLKLKVCSEIEEFFKTHSREKRTSARWEGCKFYTIDSDVSMFFVDCYNDYGQKLVYNNRFNMALIRTVGLSEGKEFKIPIDEAYTDETMRLAILDLKQKVVQFYKSFIKPIKINLRLTVEEVV